MTDLRPVGYVVGTLVALLGLTMVIPLLVDLAYGNAEWGVFLEAGVVTTVAGVSMALACANGKSEGLSIQQMFLLTTLIWLILPIFGGIPFMLGATEAGFTDAFFEAMSGMTTTGSTVFSGLDDLPEGLLLWRSMLQWFGGIGIIVVAMVFLPELKVGGMQVFRSEAFDTDGKVLPRAAEIASRISVIYVWLTVACFIAYLVVGMSGFDAINHALTTLSTGGFSTRDASFGAFQGPAEYVSSFFMILASLPFVRYVQLIAGSARPFWRDTQIHAYLAVIFGLTLCFAIYRLIVNEDHFEHSFREGIFNVTSIISGTGYASVDYQLWGAFPAVAFFFIGLIGGCAGSTACSVKIFRYQLLFASMRAQIRKIHSPNGVFTPRYQGRPVSEDVLSSVMAFFSFFIVTLGITSVLLAATGLDLVTAISGAATALACVGPGLGDIIGPSGNFASLNDPAKWVLALAMLVGRLEVMSVFALFTIRFWRS
ncbi:MULTISPECIES: TrkH family potassium uptake protein [Roseobacteraceae]|uniref:TrkH family potassium uptake protein n=1 Tax=Roseobacteraceae TaxID=2854170 RepID=UPI0005900FF6|nr:MULTISPECIES: TrkH family potassium uptake protein [Roseobacteraceae]KAB6717461.1 TrkH family potassium uptake protein [Roseobacter sp. TSBP12]|tara:strand:+ start:25298 stop:26746 length:1449 start_codon:yes stop_codon:yes gene_type:complete